MVNKLKYLPCALVGGFLASIPSMLPVFANLCFIWAAIGGAVGALGLYAISKKEELELIDGVSVGALSGVTTVLIVMGVQAIIAILFGTMYVGIGAVMSIISNDVSPLLIFGGLGTGYGLLLCLSIVVFIGVYGVLLTVTGMMGGALVGSVLYGKSPVLKSGQKPK